MCGIIAGISLEPVLKTTLTQLQRLEYRGYDSAGFAVIHDGKIDYRKTVGETKKLKLPNHLNESTIAIAHTRWATHGVPSEINAHPHVLDDKYAIIHNGIIENHYDLKNKFKIETASQTDSEIIVHLYKHFLTVTTDAKSAWESTILELEGSWATVLLDITQPERLMIACNKSPMVLGKNDKSLFVASDLYGLENIADDILYVPNQTTTCISLSSDLTASIDASWEPTPKNLIQEKIIRTDTTMLHEIMEQPSVLKACETQNISDIPKPDHLVIAACGSSYHVALIAMQWIESIAQVPCRAYLASELRYGNIAWPKNTAFMVLSQSGETADTLECVRHWKNHAAFSISICNVEKSALMRLCHYNILTPAGIETAVAATKSVTSAIYMASKLVMHWHNQQTNTLINQKDLQHQTQAILSLDTVVNFIAEKVSNHKHLFMLGKGLFHPVMLEAALKIKELCYVHTEAFAAGEMKHGPLALIEPGTMVIMIAAKNYHYKKSISNAEEMLSRGAQVILLTDEDTNQKNGLTIITLPFEINENSSISLSILFQQVSLNLSQRLGHNPDRPRNLAKCVTVE
ncbi:MAG: glutamine--fructose-6-phosphate transaminase (isomerizing) [Gammaproteobacteria bacterium]|nr:glutamine--fructose-6-phosphate transaminase (isomerizing) [Gammaproteobacteria bacterium]